MKRKILLLTTASDLILNKNIDYLFKKSLIYNFEIYLLTTGNRNIKNKKIKEIFFIKSGMFSEKQFFNFDDFEMVFFCKPNYWKIDYSNVLLFLKKNKLRYTYFINQDNIIKRFNLIKINKYTAFFMRLFQV